MKSTWIRLEECEGKHRRVLRGVYEAAEDEIEERRKQGEGVAFIY